MFFRNSRKHTSFRFFILISVLIGQVIWQGCWAGGGSGSGTATNVPVAQPPIELTAQVQDGPLFRVTLQLVSFKRGVLTEKLTDEQGAAKLSFQSNVLQSLDNDDLIYLFAKSSHFTQVKLPSGQFKAVQTNQVQFKSILPPVPVLKVAGASNPNLNQNSQINRVRTVSHFSTAKGMLVESRWIHEGILSQPLTPEITAAGQITGAQIQIMQARVSAVDDAINQGFPSTQGKFKLLAAAIKSMVEDDFNQFLTGAANQDITRPLDTLLELAINTNKPMHPVFEQKLPALNTRLIQDLTMPDFQEAFSSTTSINQINSLDSVDMLRSATTSFLAEIDSTSDPAQFQIGSGTRGLTPQLLPAREPLNHSSFAFQIYPSLIQARQVIDCSQEPCSVLPQ